MYTKNTTQKITLFLGKFYKVWQQYHYFKERNKIVKKYHLAQQKLNTHKLSASWYYNELQKLNSMHLAVEDRYANVSPY